MRRTQKENSEYVHLKAYRWALGVEGLVKNTRSLFLELARRSDDFGCCHVSRGKLADILGCSKRTIDSHFSILVGRKLIRRIGRYTPKQGQVSSVTQISAWPDRTRIPPSGHPKYGKFIKEDALESLIHARSNLQKMQGASEENSGHRIGTNELNTTTEGAETALLEHCLAALGPWADESNCRNLRRRSDTLSELLDMGFDLETGVLPVLRKMGKRDGAPPILHSWHYFADPIRKRAEARKDKQGNSETDGLGANTSPAREGKNAPYPAPSEGKADVSREMDRLLRSVATSKRVPKSGDDH